MAENKDSKLFTEFPPVSTAEWESVISADLKGADYEKKLVWRTMEGFNVRPYYRAEDLKGISYLQSKPGEYPYVRGTKENNNWLIRQTLVVECPKAANAQALDVLLKGATSLGFVINDKAFSAADLDTLLAGIDLKTTELNFSGCAVKSVAGLFLDKVTQMGCDPETVIASFNIDPIVKCLSRKGAFCKDSAGKQAFSELAELIRKTGVYKRIRMVSVNGEVFHNSGATIVQELAFALAVGHEYLVKLQEEGLLIDQAAPSIQFNLAISSNYFMEIAKFRAGRMLWANIVNSYNPTRGCASKMRVHATTSRWNSTAYDPYVNMLRGTTEGMSAAIAGVHSIEVLPFDAAYENPSEFSARIARNTQLILKEESHFNQVVDPAGGSYYLENLTQSIAENAWNLFKALEDKGGYIAAFRAGMIQEMVETSSNKKDLNLATRREILLGTNQYPNFTEVADPAITTDSVNRACTNTCCHHEAAADAVKGLKPYRGGMAFEELRLKTDRSGKRPRAFMLTVGNLTFARARAQFASNFIACAGILPVDNILFASVAEGVAAALKAKAEMVVICSSDDEYATLASEAFKQLGGKAVFVVAGEPACKADLQAVGIQNFISVKSNVLETLRGFQKELGI